MNSVLSSLEPPVEIETAAPPAASVIWLHGLGADGHDFEPLVPELRLPPRPGVRFVFPHAPYRPVTLNGGHVMRAWYDMALTEHGFSQDAGHLREAEETVHGLVRREQSRGIPSVRIVLAGFSQGGTVALQAGLHYPERLAGILALSCAVAAPAELAGTVHPANAATPIFMAHGEYDRLIPFDLAVAARRALQAGGLPVDWHVYRKDHTVCPEEIAALSRWLTGVLLLGENGGESEPA